MKFVPYFFGTGGSKYPSSSDDGKSSSTTLSSPPEMVRFNTKHKFSSQSPTVKRRAIEACRQYLVGKPMTSAEAQSKLQSNASFQNLVQSLSQKKDDWIATAISLDYGSRLRSCVENSARHGSRSSRGTNSSNSSRRMTTTMIGGGLPPPPKAEDEKYSMNA